MKIIKETKEVIVGYEAIDGMRFSDEKNCKEYEDSARCAIEKQFLDFSAKANTAYFSLSDDDHILLVDISTPERLTIANMWANARFGETPFKESMLGQKIAVNTGYDSDFLWVLGNREELISKLMKDVVDPIFGKTED